MITILANVANFFARFTKEVLFIIIFFFNVI